MIVETKDQLLQAATTYAGNMETQVQTLKDLLKRTLPYLRVCDAGDREDDLDQLIYAIEGLCP